jgi:peptidoglycan/LPS O-acetylase OafA/YrhL
MVLDDSSARPGETSPAEREQNTALDLKAAPRRLEGLTALRAVAAMAVILFHVNQRLGGNIGLPRYLPLVDRYYLGVDLFFILSGFILAHVHGADFVKLTPGRAARFYILRLARIYPVHVVLLALYLVLFLGYDVVGRHFGISIRLPGRYTAETFLGQLFLVLPNALAWNFPAWSVSAEWLAYLAFPFLAFAFCRLPARRCCAWLLTVVAGFALVYDLAFGGTMDHIGLVRVAFEFSAGYLLYRSAFAAPLPELLPALLATLMLAAALFGTRFADFGAVLAIGALVVIVARGGPRVARVVPRPLRWLGEISYSLYMVQSLTLATVGRVQAELPKSWPTASGLAVVMLLLLANILAAALLYRLVERPAREKLRRWLTRWARSTRARFEIIDIYETSG